MNGLMAEVVEDHVRTHLVDANRKLLMEEMGWDRKQIVFERYD